MASAECQGLRPDWTLHLNNEARPFDGFLNVLNLPLTVLTCKNRQLELALTTHHACSLPLPTKKIMRKRPKRERSFRSILSSVQRPASSVQRPASSVQQPASNVQPRHVTGNLALPKAVGASHSRVRLNLISLVPAIPYQYVYCPQRGFADS